MYKECIQSGEETPPLCNAKSSGLEARIHEIFMQEKKLAAECETLQRSGLTDEKITQDIHQRESLYDETKESIKKAGALIDLRKRNMLADERDIEASRRCQQSAEELYESFHSKFLARSREIGEEEAQIEKEFDKSSSKLEARIDGLREKNNSFIAEINRVIDDIHSVEARAQRINISDIDYRRAREQISAEESRSHSLQESILEVEDALTERKQMLAQAGLHQNAIQNQCAKEQLLHERLVAFNTNLEKISANSKQVADDHINIKQRLTLLEKTVKQACHTELQKASLTL